MARTSRTASPRMREVALNHRVSEFIPRYYQVYMVLQQRIREGEWSRDTLMPTEEEFTQKFGVSRVTIRKALNMLQAEKLIIREQGRGTFAAPPPRRQPRANFSGLLENIVDFELHTQVKVLVFETVKLPDDVAQQLECAPGTMGRKIVRVRSDSEAPFSFTTCYVPEPEANALNGESLGNRTVQAALAAAGVVMTTAEQRLSATVADMATANYLGVEAGSPLISMTRVMRTDKNRPVELIRALYRPDKYEYRVNLARERGGDAPRWSLRLS